MRMPQSKSPTQSFGLLYQAWLAIKVKAKQLEKTLYAVVKDLFSDYLRAELRNPRIPALLAA